MLLQILHNDKSMFIWAGFVWYLANLLKHPIDLVYVYDRQP